MSARPAGVFVIKGEDVACLPAVDVGRVILGTQIVAIVALLAWRSVAKARARRMHAGYPLVREAAIRRRSARG